MGVKALHLQQGVSNKYNGISLSCSIVFKGYRKPLEIEDVWELRDKDKTKALYTAFEKNMKSAMQKARAELEKRKRKKRRREGDPDYGNGMSKAQSQDVLVLVNPGLLLALCDTETSRSQGVGSPHFPAALFAGFSLLCSCRTMGNDRGSHDRVFLSCPWQIPIILGDQESVHLSALHKDRNHPQICSTSSSLMSIYLRYFPAMR